MVRHIANPPSRPLMIYDGDCTFCTRWIQRWRRRTGSAVEYRPAQDDQVRRQFPEIPAEQYAVAVHLLVPAGAVYIGAEAVLRAWALASPGFWLLRLYEKSPMVARLLEWSYRLVARHRRFFSAFS